MIGEFDSIVILSGPPKTNCNSSKSSILVPKLATLMVHVAITNTINFWGDSSLINWLRTPYHLLRDVESSRIADNSSRSFRSTCNCSQTFCGGQKCHCWSLGSCCCKTVWAPSSSRLICCGVGVLGILADSLSSWGVAMTFLLMNVNVCSKRDSTNVDRMILLWHPLLPSRFEGGLPPHRLMDLGQYLRCQPCGVLK